MNRVAALALALAAAAALAACDRYEGGSTAAPPSQAQDRPTPAVESLVNVPLGDVAGGQGAPTAANQANPYAGQATAVAEGRTLFVRMNCAGCHGYEAKGGMGPNLGDGYWRYGGAPVSLFKSIYEGRPQGMPAWNPALPPDEIWKLVAYLQSLGGTYPAGGYMASVQGDTPQTHYAPEVRRVMPQDAQQPETKGKSSASTSSPAARPDAGGTP